MTRAVAFDDGRRLCIDGAPPVILRPAGRIMVAMMLARRGRAISQADLADHCCPRGGSSGTIVKSHVCHTRRVLRGIGCGDMIENVWGEGYRIDPARYTLGGAQPDVLALSVPPVAMAALERYAEATGEPVAEAAVALLQEALDAMAEVYT